VTLATWLLSRELIVGSAVVGGLLSVAAMALQASGLAGRAWVPRVNRAAYLFMAISVLLFVASGLAGPRGA
jgi:hypothetical protein